MVKKEEKKYKKKTVIVANVEVCNVNSYLAIVEWLIFWLQAKAVQQMVYLFWCTVYVMFYADW